MATRCSPTGRPDGHLDIPRMRTGGVRGAIFAVFAHSDGGARDERVAARRRGARVRAGAAGRAPGGGGPGATAAAGRLLALERDGRVRIARAVGRSRSRPRGRRAGRPPIAVLHLEGAEAIDPELEALELWYGAGLRSLGPVWSRPNAFAHGVPFISPSSPDTGPGLTDAGAGARAALRRARASWSTSATSTRPASGTSPRLELGPMVASHSGVHALCPTLAKPDRSPARRDRRVGRAGRDRVRLPLPAPADFADDPDTPIELIAQHARYVADRIGVEHVGARLRLRRGHDPGGAGRRRGYSSAARGAGRSRVRRQRELAAIAWDNWRRVLGAWWRTKAPPSGAADKSH